jgi:hypothetical protein
MDAGELESHVRGLEETVANLRAQLAKEKKDKKRKKLQQSLDYWVAQLGVAKEELYRNLRGLDQEQSLQHLSASAVLKAIGGIDNIGVIHLSKLPPAVRERLLNQ